MKKLIYAFIIISAVLFVSGHAFAQENQINDLVNTAVEKAETAVANAVAETVADKVSSVVASETASATSVAPIAEEEISKIKFKTADDKTEALVVKNHSDHQTIEMNFGGVSCVMKARMNKENVRKYKELSGNDEKVLVAEVKLKEDSGFKLVDENNKLLWKVKISNGKAKISDNEENKNPFVIKKKADKIKVLDKNEKEIAKIKFYSDNGKLKLKNAKEEEMYISKDFTKLNGAIGVLAFEEIPAKLRAVIAAELINYGF